MNEREAFEKWLLLPESSYGSLYDVWQAACVWQKAQEPQSIAKLSGGFDAQGNPYEEVR
jgi:hypothetical protein